MGWFYNSLCSLKRSMLLFSFVYLFTQLFAQPEGYYSSADGKAGEELQQALHEIIDDHTVLKIIVRSGALSNRDYTSMDGRIVLYTNAVPGTYLFRLRDHNGLRRTSPVIIH